MTHTVALSGAVGHLIDVQADVSVGQVGITLVGRADATLNEGKDRIRMAIINSRLEWPTTRRTTVLLSPADLPKSGTHYDLALAVSVLAAEDRYVLNGIEDTCLIGELSLDGGLRPVNGVLPMVLAASKRGLRRVVVPEPQVREAMMVPGMEVLGFRSLAQVVAELAGEVIPDAPAVPELSGGSYLGWRGDDRLDDVDMLDLEGMGPAKYAVEVAAAGGHHVLLSGPKGCGKTSLAERVPTILPDLSHEVAVEVMALRSLAGVLDPSAGLVTRPPYSAPHHDASKASIVGGGSGRVQPGQVSLAHGGVLFLDEFALFRSDVIQALRQPLESGDVTIARGDESVTLPARAMMVLAANPCPCGNYAGGPGTGVCRCRSQDVREYQRRVGGPIADRIDITCKLSTLNPGSSALYGAPEPSAVIRERVARARQVQTRRYADERWRLNSEATGVALRERWPLTPEGQAHLDGLLIQGTVSRRGAVRIHRLAWTVADLAGAPRPELPHVKTAAALRQGADLEHTTRIRSAS